MTDPGESVGPDYHLGYEHGRRAEREQVRLREELAQLHKQWAEESSAADACEERLRKSEFDANAKAAMLEAKAERLREALERIADAHPDSNDARWAGKIARAALSQPVSKVPGVGATPEAWRRFAESHPVSNEELDEIHRDLKRQGYLPNEEEK